MNDVTFHSMLNTLNALACFEDLEDLFVKQYIVMLDAIRSDAPAIRYKRAQSLASLLSRQIIWQTRNHVRESGYRFVQSLERLQ